MSVGQMGLWKGVMDHVLLTLGPACLTSEPVTIFPLSKCGMVLSLPFPLSPHAEDRAFLSVQLNSVQ